MNFVLWILQALLAAQFLFPPAPFVELSNEEFALCFYLFLGVAELLASIGLVLPGVTRVLIWLTPLAALRIMIVTVSASVLHFSRGEVRSGLTTVVLFVMASFVAYMRCRVKPLPARKPAGYV